MHGRRDYAKLKFLGQSYLLEAFTQCNQINKETKNDKIVCTK